MVRDGCRYSCAGVRCSISCLQVLPLLFKLLESTRILQIHWWQSLTVIISLDLVKFRRLNGVLIYDIVDQMLSNSFIPLVVWLATIYFACTTGLLTWVERLNCMATLSTYFHRVWHISRVWLRLRQVESIINTRSQGASSSLPRLKILAFVLQRFESSLTRVNSIHFAPILVFMWTC